MIGQPEGSSKFAEARSPDVICVVGLGMIGGRVARALLRAGRYVYGFDSDPSVLAEFISQGGSTITPESIPLGTSIVLTALPTRESVNDVLMNPDGLVARLRTGTIVVDMSTGAHATSILTSAALSRCGIAFVDGPVTAVSRGPSDPLTMFAGGDFETVELIRSILSPAINPIHHMGPAGAGTATKLVMQYTNLLRLMVASEGLALLELTGISEELFLKVLPEASPPGYVMEMVRRARQSGNDEPAARRAPLSLFLKDFDLALNEFKALGLAPALGEAGLFYLNQGREPTESSLDCSHLISLVERAVKAASQPYANEGSTDEIRNSPH